MMTAVLIGTIALFVFGAFMALYLFHVHRGARLEQLRRRLGQKDDSLLALEDEYAGSRIARLLAESGLGWRRSTFLQWIATAGLAGAASGAIIGGVPAAVLLGLVGLAWFPCKAVLAQRKRMRSCDQQMPQALQLMVLALRAGHALPGALALAARESPAPLREELRRAVEEQSLGRPISSVIERLARRLPSCDSAQSFAVAILVLEQTGGNLIHVIERIIESSRARVQYLARLRALTAEGRMSALILGLMPLAFFLIAGLLDPSYWKTIFLTSSGRVVLALLVSLWVAGGAWTYRLVSRQSI